MAEHDDYLAVYPSGWPDFTIGTEKAEQNKSGRVEYNYERYGREARENRTARPARAPTAEDYRLHLEGKKSLVVTPITPDNKTWRIVLDIDYRKHDDYQAEMVKFIGGILIARGISFYMSPSKSDGIYFTIPFAELQPADKAIAWAESLRAHVMAEFDRDYKIDLFPKNLVATDAVLPNGVNIPMFGDKTPIVRSYNAKTGKQVHGQAMKSMLDSGSIFSHLKTLNNGGDFLDTPIKRLQPKSKAERSTKFRLIKGAGRNETIFKSGASMQARGATDDDITTALQRHNTTETYERAHCDDVSPLPHKELDTIIKQVLKLEKGDPISAYVSDLEAMNEDWALVTLGGKAEFLDLKSGLALDTYSKQSWSDYIANRKIQIGAKTVPIGPIWLQWEGRRDIKTIVYKPVGTEAFNEYNMWQGLAIKPREGDPSLFLDHLRDCICGGDTVAYDVMLMWLADLVQSPLRRRFSIAPILTGPQGTGKTLLLNFIAKFFHDANAYTLTGESSLKDFNEALAGKVFIGGNEVLFHGDKRMADKLKAYISDSVIEINGKYKSAKAVPNRARFMFTTNHQMPVELEQDDRRWLVLGAVHIYKTEKGREKLAQLWDYFNAGGAAEVLHYLLNRVVVDEDLMKQSAHITEKKADVVLESNPMMKVIHSLAQEGVLPYDFTAQGKVATVELIKYAKETLDAYQAREVSGRTVKEFFEQNPEFGKMGARRCYALKSRGSMIFKQSESDPGQWLNKEACSQDARGIEMATPRAIMKNLAVLLPGLDLGSEVERRWRPYVTPGEFIRKETMDATFEKIRKQP